MSSTPALHLGASRPGSWWMWRSLLRVGTDRRDLLQEADGPGRPYDLRPRRRAARRFRRPAAEGGLLPDLLPGVVAAGVSAGAGTVVGAGLRRTPGGDDPQRRLSSGRPAREPNGDRRVARPQRPPGHAPSCGRDGTNPGLNRRVQLLADGRVRPSTYFDGYLFTWSDTPPAGDVQVVFAPVVDAAPASGGRRTGHEGSFRRLWVGPRTGGGWSR